MQTLPSSVNSRSVAKTRFIEPEGSRFRDDFNRNSFLFSHNLAGNPLFELPRLTTLAETLLTKEGPTALRWKNSDVPVDAKWAQLPPNEQVASVSEAIQNLQKSGSWVVLYRTQNDPEYRAVLEQVLDDMEELMGWPLRNEITWKDIYIFMASPHAITPYHIDHEMTFLLQVHGNRLAHLWDQKDRSVLTDPEIEGYYMGELGAATYQETKQAKAYVYPMDAGKGVLHPSLAPHYYKNGDNYSVAIGIHLCLKSADRLARAYQVNACLRKLGLSPTSPGRFPWRDRIKIGALSLLDKKKPKTKSDLIRSGITRLRAPLRLAGKLRKR
jgi:hypothetical protein